MNDVGQARGSLLRAGQFLAQLLIAERQRNFGFLDDHGKFARAQQRHGADGDGAGLDHAEPAGGEHRCVGGTQQYSVAGHHA